MNTTSDYSRHIRETLKLSGPIIVGQLGHVTMGIIDNVMVGKLGALPLAASAFAISILIVPLIVGLGISYAISPLTAIARGENDEPKLKLLFAQGFLLNTVSALLLSFLSVLSISFFPYMGQSKETVEMATPFMLLISFSIIPVMVYQVGKQFMDGFEQPKVAMFVTISANLINFIGNYLLIYGNFGFPKMGLPGAGLSTLLSRVYMAVVVMFYIFKSKKFKKYSFSFSDLFPDKKMQTELLKLGGPSALQFLFEVGAFSFAAIMVGWISAKALAAHQIALSIASLTYMVTIGFASGSAIRVGERFGRKDYREVRTAGFTGVLLVILSMLVTGGGIILCRDIIPPFYVPDSEVWGIASGLLIITALFQVFDGLQGVSINILRGITDTFIPTLIAFFSYWVVSLPAAYILAFTFRLKTEGIWIGLLLGLLFAGVLLFSRFAFKTNKLIASAVHNEDSPVNTPESSL